MPNLRPFHLAFPVNDLVQARIFYGKLLGCEEGQSADHWVDYDFFGHQIVAHCVSADDSAPTNDVSVDTHHNPVDGHDVPVPHFGVVLDWDEWHTLSKRLTNAGVEFVIEPYIRFKGEVGEQATMFLLDPSGNALEFKAFRDPAQLFAK